MFFLDTTSKTVEFLLASPVTSVGLQYTASWADYTTTTLTPGASDGISNNTTPVTVVPAPASGTQRQVKYLSVFNSDSVASQVTVQINDSGGTRILLSPTLQPGDVLIYDEHNGWQVLQGDGSIKAGFVGPQGANGTNGANGMDGTDGNIWITGSGAPGGVASAVNAGDMYLNTASGDVYQAFAPGTGSWGSPIENLTGPSGSNGTNGTDGTNGNLWFTGTATPGGAVPAVNAGDLYLRTTTGDVYVAGAPGSGSWGSSIENLMGPTGSNGSNGTNGNLIFTGAGSPNTVVSAVNAGDIYLDTTTEDIYQASAPGTMSWGSPITNIQGTNGTNGTDGTNGNIWLTGSGPPSVAALHAGDMYLNTASGDVYQAFAPGTGSWGSPIENLVGPQGPPVNIPGTLGEFLYNNGSGAVAADSTATTNGSGTWTGVASIVVSGVIGSSTAMLTGGQLSVGGAVIDGTYPISASLGGSIVITNGVITAINPAL